LNQPRTNQNRHIINNPLSRINLLEQHFDLKNDLTLNLIKLDFTVEFYRKRIDETFTTGTDRVLSIESNTYNDDLDKDTEFEFIKSLPFIDFFKSSLIDVPVCFSKSKSLRRRTRDTSFSKFLNYTTLHGNKQRTSNFFMRALKMNLLELVKLDKSSDLTWRSIFMFFSSVMTKGSAYKELYIRNPDANDDESLYYRLGDYTSKFDYNTVFFKQLKALEPLFLFYIYKVDKSIFKNSRGRSGKFTFIWKYITPYKRNLLVFHWLAKELRVINKKSLGARLDHLIKQVIFERKTTWIYKIRRFSYNYVYYNCRFTLARSYRTVTR